MKSLLIFALFILYSCSDSPTGSGGTTELLSIYDYNYLDNQYFFVDSYYRDRFESSYSEDLSVFQYEQGMEIVDLEVGISTDNLDSDGIPGAAVLDPTDPVWQEYSEYLDIPDEMGKVESGYFRLLPDSLYSFDPYRGFLWLTKL